MSICTERGADRGQPRPIHEQGVAVIYGEDLRLSIRALLGRPAESLLLAVGVAVAVGATVTGIALAGTAATISERLLASLRHREIIVTTKVGSETMESPGRKLLPGRVELTVEDLDRARSVTQAVQYAYMAEETSFLLTERGDGGPQPEDTIRVVKVTPDYFAARELQAAAGSLFTPDDIERGEPIMVVGAELGATLFEEGEAFDRTLVANFRLFRIIGVLERSRTEADEQAFIPAGFLRQNYRPSGEEASVIVIMDYYDMNSLRFTVADRSLLDEARVQVAGYFDATYGEGVLNITDPRGEAHTIADRYRRLVRVIVFLALSALLIATLNMSNILASRALRRRRSAGILKAMGAACIRVFVVFLMEALVVGAIGSAAGVGLAAGLAHLMEQEFGFGGFDPGLIAAGIVASWTIVAACSVLPALAAARTPAAEAIRYE